MSELTVNVKELPPTAVFGKLKTTTVETSFSVRNRRELAAVVALCERLGHVMSEGGVPNSGMSYQIWYQGRSLEPEEIMEMISQQF